MPVIDIKAFNATAPLFGARALPDTMAVVADNVDLRFKFLHPIAKRGAFQTAAATTINRSFRIQGDDGTEKWFSFPEGEADLAKSPVVNDSFERYYWATPGGTSGDYLKVADYPGIDTDEATMQEWTGTATGRDYYRVGVPTPRTGASVTVTGGSAANETRYYTYTFLNNFGEEGPPAPPFSATGPSDGSWDVASMDAGASHPDFTGRDITTKRIYRTLPGTSGQTVFYKVDEVALATTSYSDVIADTTVASNLILQSIYWNLPPSSIDGFVITQNGFVVAWKGRDLYLSEAYRPHAFPPQYRRVLEHAIVGIGVFGGALVICTEGAPYLLTGNTPSVVSLTKFDTAEPCLFKRSIVTMPYGVLYASPNGLALASNSGVQIMTSQIISATQWANYTSGPFYAARFFNRYVAFHSDRRGFMFNPEDSLTGFSALTSSTAVRGLEQDMYTGKMYSIEDDGVYVFADSTDESEIVTWKSKIFNLGAADNLGAAQIDFDSDNVFAGAAPALTTAQDDFNAALFAAPYMAPFGGGVFGGYYQHPTITEPASNLLPFGADQFYRLAYQESPGGFLTLNVYADDELNGTYEVTSRDTFKLESGFKRENWQFELIGNVDVYEFRAATTAKELGKV